jgi:PAS domain-containing protein
MTLFQQYTEAVTHIGVIVAVLCAAGSGLWVAWKRVFQPLYKMYEKINTLCAEFLPNGGHSFTDRFGALAQTVTDLCALTEQLSREVRTIRCIKQCEQERGCEPIIEFDADLNMTRANSAALDLMDLPQDQALGNGWKNAVEPGCLRDLCEELQGAAADLRRVHRVVPMILTGGTHATRWVLYPISYGDKTFLGFWGAIAKLD